MHSYFKEWSVIWTIYNGYLLGQIEHWGSKWWCNKLWPNILWFHATNVQSFGCIIFTWKMSFDRYNNERSVEESECSINWKTEQRKKFQKQKKGK